MLFSVRERETLDKGRRAKLCLFFGFSCTSELKRIWQTLQEMTGRLVLISGTPKVWFITAFCTGSICSRKEEEGNRRRTVEKCESWLSNNTTTVVDLVLQPDRLQRHHAAGRPPIVLDEGLNINVQMTTWIKYTDKSFTASIQCLLYVCVLQTVASVDSMLLQLRHLLHPTRARLLIPTRLRLHTARVLIVSAGMSITDGVKRLV